MTTANNATTNINQPTERPTIKALRSVNWSVGGLEHVLISFDPPGQFSDWVWQPAFSHLKTKLR